MRMTSSRSMHRLPRRNHWELLALLSLLLLSFSEAFLSQKQSGWRYAQQQESIISSALQIAKSGGKMIETEDMYVKIVLADDVPRPVLVFFSAPWCGPCRLTNPVVKEIMKQFATEMDVVEVCTDDLAEIAEQAGVVSIPTIQFYYRGEVLDTVVGCVAKSVLANAVDKVLDDVKQLRKQAP